VFFGLQSNQHLWIASHTEPLHQSRSAKKINQLLARRGRLWMDESSNHIIRNREELDDKAEYIKHNLVKKVLAKQPSDYEWRFISEKSKPTG
jgi:hypothetical protein